jgi:hypothetical protein
MKITENTTGINLHMVIIACESLEMLPYIEHD